MAGERGQPGSDPGPPPTLPAADDELEPEEDLVPGMRPILDDPQAHPRKVPPPLLPQASLSWRARWRPAGGWLTYAVVLVSSLLLGIAGTWGYYQATQPASVRLIIAPTPSPHTSIRIIRQPAPRASTSYVPVTVAPTTHPPPPATQAAPSPTPTPTPSPTPSPAFSITGVPPPDTSTPTPGVTDTPVTASPSQGGQF